jgi:lipoprotein LpqH
MFFVNARRAGTAAASPTRRHCAGDRRRRGRRHSRAVNCTQFQSSVTITAGDNASGMTAVVDLASKPAVKSVGIHDLGGFTGSYWQDLGPVAQVRTGTTTYQITGTADGFHVDAPSFRKTETFAIKVAC